MSENSDLSVKSHPWRQSMAYTAHECKIERDENYLNHLSKVFNLTKWSRVVCCVEVDPSILRLSKCAGHNKYD